jgi:hypothetical protein
VHFEPDYGLVAGKEGVVHKSRYSGRGSFCRN